MKTMQPSDWIESKVKFPVIAEPKIDGVRAHNTSGKLLGRSMKPFKNLYLTARFSHSALLGMDGEIAANHECHPDLCRITSSATGTIKGEPYIIWWLFDFVTVESIKLPYERRLLMLEQRLHELRRELPDIAKHLRMIPWKHCQTMEELLEYDEENLIAGFEGTCFRSPKGVHKQGRSTPTEGGVLRIKRFVDFEFQPYAIIEGEENQNEATINERGLTERSSHQENMVPNGMVGAMLGNVIGVVKDPTTGAVLFNDGDEVRVGAGCLNHEQRKLYFIHQDKFLSQVSKAKFFPKGIKDKPRFPTWQSFRNPEDMSND